MDHLEWDGRARHDMGSQDSIARRGVAWAWAWAWAWVHHPIPCAMAWCMCWLVLLSTGLILLGWIGMQKCETTAGHERAGLAGWQAEERGIGHMGSRQRVGVP